MYKRIKNIQWRKDSLLNLEQGKPDSHIQKNDIRALHHTIQTLTQKELDKLLNGKTWNHKIPKQKTKEINFSDIGPLGNVLDETRRK